MLIANPIYDSVFKFLLDDKKVAIKLLSLITDMEFIELNLQPSKFNSNLKGKRHLMFYMLNFSAKVKLSDGNVMNILIEIHKAEYHTDIMPFNKYPVDRHGNTLPVFSIYFLGHCMMEKQDMPVIRVKREHLDDVTGQEFSRKEEFLESLTNDSIIIQIPALKRQRHNFLESVLDIFGEAKPDNYTFLFSEEDYPEEYRDIIRRLQTAANEPALQKKMDIEDEIHNELNKLERMVAERDEVIEETKEEDKTPQDVLDDSSKQIIFKGTFHEKMILDFVKNSPLSAAIFDRNMVYLTCSDQHLRDIGLTKEQVIGKNHYDIFPGLTQKYHDAHQQALRGTVVKNNGDQVMLPDGTIRYMIWECHPWYDEEGQIGGMILYAENTTAQMRLLQKAKDQAEREKKLLDTVLAHIDSGVVAIDIAGNVLYENNALLRILGFTDKPGPPSNAKLFENLFRFFSYPERNELPLDKWPLLRLYDGEIIENEKYIIQRIATGKEQIIEYFGTPVCNAEENFEFGLLMLSDVTERQRAEEELRKTKELAEQEQAKWLTVLDHVSNGVAVFDTSGTLIYANNMQKIIFGFTEEVYQRSNEFIKSVFTLESYPDGRNLPFDEWPYVKLLKGKQQDRDLFRVKRLDKDIDVIVMFFGEAVYDAQGKVELVVAVSTDITEQVEREKQAKRMQEHMEQTQRLESLGVLAGGIAHDFNNLLVGILGNVDILLRKLPEFSPIERKLENIKTASLRAAELCTQLLAYSGQGKIEEKEFSVNKLIAEMEQMLKTSISKNCILDLNLRKQLSMIVGDSSQIQQIVMNFIINASESIGDLDGTINISTDSINCSKDFFTDDFVIKPTKPGYYVTLEVSDNGHGMNKETLRRIFEPFFTTKFTGRGLGLSAVLGIIRSHEGGLKVCSEPGIGTTFTVFFPAISGNTESVLDNTECIDEKAENLIGKVLLVDDEDIVRNVCSSQLEWLGLEVLTARDGLDAIDIYRENQTVIDLVILDLTMPRMSGDKTFQILRQLNSGVKVVLSSGYAEEEMMKRFAGEKPSGYLRKPFTINQLFPVLSGLLSSRY